MPFKYRRVCCSGFLAALAACTSASGPAPISGAQDDAARFTLRTEMIEVAPGSERYLCYAQTLQEDLVIDTYRSDPQGFVHHLVLARALVPEPEGPSECDTLFRATWEPLYITGAGDSELALPKGSGHTLPKGTQLVLQMHLLNAGSKPVRDRVEVDLQRSALERPRPVSTYIFGTTQLSLPPLQRSEAQSLCEMTEPITLIAGFPHMHALGRSLRFEVGSAPDNMRSVFTRDPYDFDDQHIESMNISLSAGELTRLTCAYDNPRAEVVRFGESTRDEMCLFIAFALDQTSVKECATRGP